MSKRRLFCKCATALLLAATTMLSGVSADRVALVIGVDNYDSDDIPDLDGAVRDARIMSAALKQLSPSFEVQLLEDPSLDEALDAIDVFMGSSKKAECAMVYFAGHGIEYHGENFLLTADSTIADNIETGVESTKRRLRRKLLSLNLVMDEIELTEADLKLLVLDACRNNPIEVNDGNKTRSLGGGRGLARVSAPLGMLVSYSADAGQVANDGLFTEILSKNLVEPDLSVMEVFAKTRDEVNATSLKRKQEDSRYNTQLPAEYNKLGFKGIKFVFNKQEASKPPPPPPPVTPPTMPKTNPNPPTLAGQGDPPASNFKNKAGIHMIHLKGGVFQMGDSLSQGDLSERPVRQVELSPFHLAAYEVTQGQWSAIMGQSVNDLRKAAGFNGSTTYGEGANHPVYYTSWEAAADFCRQLTAKERAESGLPKNWSYKLPTEAQWEYACRAGSTKPFAGDPFELGNIGGYGGAEVIGNFQANAFGLFDMHGNVWEWCQDFYKENYEGLSTKNPVGPTAGEMRVFRGGSWLDMERAARASNRGYALPTLSHRAVGFRVALVKEE